MRDRFGPRGCTLSVSVSPAVSMTFRGRVEIGRPFPGRCRSGAPVREEPVAVRSGWDGWRPPRRCGGCTGRLRMPTGRACWIQPASGVWGACAPVDVLTLAPSRCGSPTARCGRSSGTTHAGLEGVKEHLFDAGARRTVPPEPSPGGLLITGRWSSTLAPELNTWVSLTDRLGSAAARSAAPMAFGCPLPLPPSPIRSSRRGAFRRRGPAGGI